MEEWYGVTIPELPLSTLELTDLMILTDSATGMSKKSEVSDLIGFVAAGPPGKELEIRVTDVGLIQSRYEGDVSWTTLRDLTTVPFFQDIISRLATLEANLGPIG
jgi:hypothetical protein